MSTHSAQLQKIQELIITLFNDPFSLTALSDADYQKKVWLEVDQWERPVLGTSARVRDCCMKIFQIPLACEYIGERNFTLLKDLYDALDAYDFKIGNYQRSYIRCSEDGCCNRLKKEEIQEVLDDPQWHAIRNLAKEVYDSLEVQGVFSERELGKALRFLLEKKPFDTERIARWAEKVSAKYPSELSDDLRELFQSLEMMPYGTGLEYSEEKLRTIADALLAFRYRKDCY